MVTSEVVTDFRVEERDFALGDRPIVRAGILGSSTPAVVMARERAERG